MHTRNAIVCIGTKRLPSADLVEKGRNHVRLMTGNPSFPDPSPSLSQIAAACDALEAANLRCESNGGRLDTWHRNEQRAVLCGLIRRLAGYVSAVAQGNHAIVLSAGFTCKKRRQPSTPMAPPPQVVAVRAVLPGCIDVRWGAVKGRRLYRVWINDDDPSRSERWRLLTQTTKNHLRAEALESDRVYAFRISAIGVLGEGPLSDIALGKAA